MQKVLIMAVTIKIKRTVEEHKLIISVLVKSKITIKQMKLELTVFINLKIIIMQITFIMKVPKNKISVEQQSICKITELKI